MHRVGRQCIKKLIGKRVLSYRDKTRVFGQTHSATLSHFLIGKRQSELLEMDSTCLRKGLELSLVPCGAN